jgi:hypothetical protein
MRALVALLAVFVLGCGGSQTAGKTGKGGKDETAAQRARREQAEDDKVSGEGKAWGGWQYQGSRDECFFKVGRKCFTEQADACKAAKCGKGKCRLDGGGPAIVSCKK